MAVSNYLSGILLELGGRFDIMPLSGPVPPASCSVVMHAHINRHTRVLDDGQALWKGRRDPKNPKWLHKDSGHTPHTTPINLTWLCESTHEHHASHATNFVRAGGGDGRREGVGWAVTY